MNANEYAPAEAEHRNHRYVGNTIPWYIHLLWVLFWIFAIGYVLTYLFPDIQREFRRARSQPVPTEKAP